MFKKVIRTTKCGLRRQFATKGTPRTYILLDRKCTFLARAFARAKKSTLHLSVQLALRNYILYTTSTALNLSVVSDKELLTKFINNPSLDVLFVYCNYLYYDCTYMYLCVRYYYNCIYQYFNSNGSKIHKLWNFCHNVPVLYCVKI